MQEPHVIPALLRSLIVPTLEVNIGTEFVYDHVVEGFEADARCVVVHAVPWPWPYCASCLGRECRRRGGMGKEYKEKR
jgi:hypothetical protein